jgi:hypothetical protein
MVELFNLASPAPHKGAGFVVPRSSAPNLQIKMIIITYILVSSIIATGAFAVGRAQRRERRRLCIMVQGAHIPHRLETPVSELAKAQMELELARLQLESERLETDRLRSIIRSTMR